MAWADGEDVMNRVEGLMKALWHAFSDHTPAPGFHRMRYDDAMAKYGSDKPDLRIPGSVSSDSLSLGLQLTCPDPTYRSHTSR
jgi:aspartyl-tRNA synthetase